MEYDKYLNTCVIQDSYNWSIPAASRNMPNHKVINNLYGNTSWISMRCFPPLHEIKKEWQPNLAKVSVYYYTGAELLQGGWNKWNSAGHPDMLAKSSAAVEPDWHTRRQCDIRNADKKYCEQSAYDRWGKPNSFAALSVCDLSSNENPPLQPLSGEQKLTNKPGRVHTGIKAIHYGIGKGFGNSRLVS
ncbi:hypothetical protein EWB00_007334 [Schistosoma japonicum]|uniref:Uncharacterized protein n=1 Tax=Schistosoma japonicum TaxID=6182 RepID=A0A4Z2CUX8_SCHJA|nr:hypothetical protein EWB00_007334 [Schistosoma japonicum]